jgi:hypothetical protein
MSRRERSPTDKFPVLATSRLKLRAIAPTDGAEFRVLMSIPDVTRYSNCQKGYFKGVFHDFRMFGRVAADAMM